MDPIQNLPLEFFQEDSKSALDELKQMANRDDTALIRLLVIINSVCEKPARAERYLANQFDGPSLLTDTINAEQAYFWCDGDRDSATYTRTICLAFGPVDNAHSTILRDEAYARLTQLGVA